MRVETILRAGSEQPALQWPQPSGVGQPEDSEIRVTSPVSAGCCGVHGVAPYTTVRDAALDGHLPIILIPGPNRMWFDRRDLDRAIDVWKGCG